MADVTFPLGAEEIEAVLPHRAPFRWVSRVVSCTPGKEIVAELDVDPNLALFEGHFPDYPVLPGVIIMEALAQAASFCALVGRENAGTVGFLTGIDKAKFRNQVRPGDTVVLKAEIVKSSSRLVVAEVEASVGDAVCATATQRYVLASSSTTQEA